MSDPDYEDWEEIGAEVNHVYHELMHLSTVLSSLPKELWHDEFEAADDVSTRDDYGEIFFAYRAYRYRLTREAIRLY